MPLYHPGLVTAEAANASAITTLQARVNDGALRWCATTEGEITGAGGTGVQAFQAAGTFDTIVGGTLRANDRVKIRAEWECTKNTGSQLVMNIYWGTAAAGTALLRTSSVLAIATGLMVKAEVELMFRTVGANPVWGFFSEWMTPSNTTYEDMVKSYDLTSQSTAAAIVIEASAQIAGTVDAGDKVRLRSFSREIIRTG